MLIETLELIRILSCDNKKRMRFRNVKMSEVDSEFRRIVKTIRLRKDIAKTGYNYLKVYENKGGDKGWELHIQGLKTHGSKVIINSGNWKEFVTWVEGYRWNGIDKPCTLEEWKKKYGK